MIVFYTLENRSAVFTLLFGIKLIVSSPYGFCPGTWPFGVIEAVWVVAAFRKHLEVHG